MTEAAHMPYAVTPPPGENELPYSDGVPVESETHRKQQGLLTHTLELAWAERTDFYVGANMFVYYSHLQAKKNDFRGPDVFVVLGTARRVRKSWVVWEEAGRTPDVVIELLSATTEATDRGEKMRIYAQLLHVPYYYLFDPETGVLEGYRLDTAMRAYVAMSPAPSGDLDCPVLGLGLGVRHGPYEGVETDWLRWLDAAGEPLPTAEEQARAMAEQARAAAEQARAAEQRAEEQAREREGAERRLAAALAELEQLRASRSGG
jgi:Uma2 family endonuclease